MKRVTMIWILLILVGSFPVIAAQVHEVSRQDSLYQISRWYGVSVQELGQNNNLAAPYIIYPGQVIIVPPGKAKAGELLYRVKAGDSLFTIASRFQTTPTAIIESNNLSEPELYAGQALRIKQPPATLPPVRASQPKMPQTATQPAKSVYYYNIPDLIRDFPGRLFLKGASGKKQVALTFDDGPDGVYTSQILDILAHHGVRATFFLRGDKVAKNSQLTKRILAEGHILGNHSWSHPNLRKLSAEQIRLELTKTNKEIKSWTGVEPALVRPPYGELSREGMVELVNLDQYLINWSADSGDWQARERDQVLIGAIPKSTAGAIVLMHCAGGQGQSLIPTIEALPYFIYTLRVQGYSFVTVDELLDIPAYRS